jgi:hypothetical protein
VRHEELAEIERRARGGAPPPRGVAPVGTCLRMRRQQRTRAVADLPAGLRHGRAIAGQPESVLEGI